VDDLYGISIGSSGKLVNGKESLVFAGEDDAAAINGEVEGCVSDPIPCEQQPPVGLVPKGQRKLTGDVLECGATQLRKKL
jgi:hypothetical protein